MAWTTKVREAGIVILKKSGERLSKKGSVVKSVQSPKCLSIPFPVFWSSISATACS